MADDIPGQVQDTAANSRFVDITLAEPIERGKTKIATLTLRKPRAGELRGLTLQDLIGTDVSAIIKIIPRISNPPLTLDEVDRLDADDFAEIGGAIRGFFMTSAERQVLEKMIADQQPTT